MLQNMERMSVGLVAGEASGDMLGAALLAAMRQRWHDMQSYGIGGEAMQAQGLDCWWPSDLLAVHGITEALKVYLPLLRLRRALALRLQAQNPALFIGIDAPDFNLGLEAMLRKQGIPTMHYISPSVWAWRSGRIQRIAQSTDHILCLFPFEKKLYDAAGIAATYVGHPLAAKIPLKPDRSAARQALGLPQGLPVLAVMPGSRRAEIQHIAPRFLQTVQLLRQARPDMRFVLPAAPGRYRILQDLLQSQALSEHVLLLDGQAHQALAACDVTLIASGTATLEAMLYKCPMVIAYVLSAVSWQIMRRMSLQPWVGLPNILARSFVVPELLQDAATPKNLAAAVLHWFDHPEQLEQLVQRFSDMHQELLRDSGTLCTEAIQNLLNATSSRLARPTQRDAGPSSDLDLGAK